MNEQHYLLLSDLFAAGDVIPFLGAGANLCDRPDEAPGSPDAFLPNGAELARALAERSRYPLHEDARPAPRLAVRRRDPRREAALPVPPRRSSTSTIRRTRSTASSPRCRPCSASGLAPAARHHDELRRPARARPRRARRVVRPRLVRGEARRAAAASSSIARRAGRRRHRAPEQVHGLLSLGAPGDPQAPRRRRPRRPEGRQLRHHRGQLHRLPMRGDIGGQIPITLARADGGNSFLFLGYCCATGTCA